MTRSCPSALSRRLASRLPACGLFAFSLVAFVCAFAPTAQADVIAEAESLSRTTSGPTATNDSDSAASGGSRVTLASTAVGQWIEFTLPSVPAGTYSVQLRDKHHNNRGILALRIDGVQIGSTLDQYASPATYPTTTFGNVTFASAGSHALRLTVTGKNAASTNFSLSADRIALITQSGGGSAAPPSFSPGGGSFTVPQSVTISTSTSGASIRYTTNGSTPTSTSGTVYTGPITVSSTTMVRAIAYASGLTDSPVASATYTIGGASGDTKLPVPASAVTASSNDGNVPANAVDGNLGTRWSASGSGQWIKFDLGGNKRLGSVKLAFYNGNARTSTFDVEASMDNVSFSPVRTGIVSALNTALQTFDLPDSDPVRYVRIVGRGNSVNTWNSYTEVELWGGNSNGTPDDTQPPSAPSNLVVTSSTTTSISLSWGASSDNVGVTGYTIFNSGTQAGTAAGTSHTVGGLSPATTYSFTVRARDAAGNVSGPSNSATGTTQTGSGPGAPAKPIIQIVQGSPSYTVTWNKWAGISGTSWQMFENGKLIHSSSIPDAGNNVQSGSVVINGKTYGAYEYRVVLTNSSGSTASDPVSTIIGGASKIILQEADPDRQALQATVNQGVSEYTLSTLGAASPSYAAATNNSSVVSAQIVSGKLRVTALKEGRASVRITESSTNQTRFVGIRVRTSTGQLPGMPSYVAVGSVSEDSTGDLDFWKAFDPGLKNRRMDIRYIYINGGPINGWRTWNQPEGWRAISYIRESMKLGMIPFFVYYNIPEGSESYDLDRAHLADASYMAAYFRDLKFFLDIARNEAGDELVGIVLEPDLLGYMMQNSPVPPSQIPARVDQIYRTGVLSAGSDPTFPNTLVGYVNAVNYAIRKHYPKAYFGWQFNLWASNNQPATGIIRATDSMGIAAGRQRIVTTAQEIANYYVSCGINSSGANFVSIDKYGLDAGISSPSNPAQSTWFWNADHWNNYLLFSKTLGQTTGKPVILWQIPVGHINTSQMPNPYNGGTFPALPNTEQRYEDSAPTFFLGDSFAPGTSTRQGYFATNLGGDSKVNSSGSAVTWGNHMPEAATSNIIAVLFGAGVGSSTDGVGSPPTDNFWWITAVQRYYQNPAPR